MNDFLKLQLPINERFLSSKLSKGAFKYNLGDFLYYNLLQPYRIFDAKFFSIMRPDSLSYVEILGKETAAHLDVNVNVNLNVYVNGNGGVTEFYTSSVESENNWFDLKNLTKCNEFVANENDIYLLNAQEIHRVSSMGNSRREIIQACWHNKSFQEVKLLFQQTYGLISV
jgi:hypothetical protein